MERPFTRSRIIAGVSNDSIEVLISLSNWRGSVRKRSISRGQPPTRECRVALSRSVDGSMSGVAALVDPWLICHMLRLRQVKIHTTNGPPRQTKGPLSTTLLAFLLSLCSTRDRGKQRLHRRYKGFRTVPRTRASCEVDRQGTKSATRREPEGSESGSPSGYQWLQSLSSGRCLRQTNRLFSDYL